MEESGTSTIQGKQARPKMKAWKRVGQGRSVSQGGREGGPLRPRLSEPKTLDLDRVRKGKSSIISIGEGQQHLIEETLVERQSGETFGQTIMDFSNEDTAMAENMPRTTCRRASRSG